MTEELTKEELVQQVNDLTKQEEEAPGIKTEVTSIKEEEKKTPEEIAKISEQEYVDRAMQDYMGGTYQIELMLKNMSKRGICRAFLAVLKLPEEGQKVRLQSKEEQMVFGIGQRVISARMTLIMNHMKGKIIEDREKEATKEVKTEENVS